MHKKRSVLEVMRQLPAAELIDINEPEVPFSQFCLNEPLNIHQLVSERSDQDRWFGQFMAVKQKFSEDLDMYIEGFDHDHYGNSFYVITLCVVRYTG